MQTDCRPDCFLFARVESRRVVADFEGGAITFDAGALLLCATIRAIGLVNRFAVYFSDRRWQDLIEHDVVDPGGDLVRGDDGGLLNDWAGGAGRHLQGPRLTPEDIGHRPFADRKAEHFPHHLRQTLKAEVVGNVQIKQQRLEAGTVGRAGLKALRRRRPEPVTAGAASAAKLNACHDRTDRWNVDMVAPHANRLSQSETSAPQWPQAQARTFNVLSAFSVSALALPMRGGRFLGGFALPAPSLEGRLEEFFEVFFGLPPNFSSSAIRRSICAIIAPCSAMMCFIASMLKDGKGCCYIPRIDSGFDPQRQPILPTG